MCISSNVDQTKWQWCWGLFKVHFLSLQKWVKGEVMDLEVEDPLGATNYLKEI